MGVSLALDGIRVLDFSQGMAGALTTMVLADYGAEVIRVEPPGGDPWWAHPAYLLWNRGKKSIMLDLSSSDGLSHAEELVASTDVLVESFRPGRAAELGIGHDKCAALNPSLVYLSISAFGQTGPYKNYKAYDGIVNAKTGRMRDQIGHERNRPIFRAVNDTSYHTAMFSVQAILAALRVVTVTGLGQHVETSLLRGVTAPNNPWRRFEGHALPPDRYPGQKADLDQIRTGVLIADRREHDPLLAMPGSLCAECQDGRWIMHSQSQDKMFRAWIHAIGFDWIWNEPRFKAAPSFSDDGDRVELNRALMARMKERTSAEWIEIYRQNPDVVGEVMLTTQEAMRHEQFIHNGHLIEVDDPRVGRIKQVGPLVMMSKTPAVITRPAPRPGEHTAEILSQIPPRDVAKPSGNGLSRPLEGVIILELASWLATPFAGSLLADLGARVIKIESLSGDNYRKTLTLEPPSGATFGTDNMIRALQGKEGLAVDLKSAAGREILHRLVARADVLVHNFRPGVPERLGMDYETLRGIKPELVYVYASAYGSSGPDTMRAAMNPTMGAISGNSVFQSGEGNIPIGDQSPDPIAGSAVATGVMLGLAARWRTGKGQYLETTMMNSVVYCNSDDALDYTSKPPRRNPDHLQLGLEATYRLYETSEGWVFLAAMWDDEFRAFCTAIERHDLASDARYSAAASRYEHRVELGQALEEVFKLRSADEWERELFDADVACVRADGSGHRRFLHMDLHAKAVRMMVPTSHPIFAASAPDGTYWRHGPVVNFSATPCEEGRPYTDVGEHTVSILEDLGYDEDDILRLKQADIVGWPEYVNRE